MQLSNCSVTTAMLGAPKVEFLLCSSEGTLKPPLRPSCQLWLGRVPTGATFRQGGPCLSQGGDGGRALGCSGCPLQAGAPSAEGVSPKSVPRPCRSFLTAPVPTQTQGDFTSSPAQENASKGLLMGRGSKPRHPLASPTAADPFLWGPLCSLPFCSGSLKPPWRSSGDRPPPLHHSTGTTPTPNPPELPPPPGKALQGSSSRAGPRALSGEGERGSSFHWTSELRGGGAAPLLPCAELTVP